MMDFDISGADFCRVCRSEGLPDRPLFHPCICTGSIKWIHQECLMQWMRYSRKEHCELCGHRFSFTPIYSPDMPRRLPLRDVAGGLLTSIATAVKYWLHYTLVALAWLGVVPLMACRMYRCLFTGTLDSILTLPLDIISPDNIGSDVFHGCFVVTCTLFAFIGLVWLREQILHGGGPDWLERENAGGGVGGEGENQDQVIGDNNNVPNENQNENIIVNQPAGGRADDALIDNGVENQQPQVNVAAIAEDDAGEPAEPAVGDEANWNPVDWDRAAEDLTWERLLGFDGSLVFLEHVFWVISLNTLFILIFAFCPYHIGHAAIITMGLREQATASNFEGMVTTLCGYCVIGLCLVTLHHIAGLLGLRKSRRILGLGYVVVKVSLLSVVEIGVLPLICGWWLDICSLAMFDATLKDRETSFRLAPGTSMFLHWLVGMVYVYYFASFILLLREVLRPGVLWFLRNLNDPDFSPIQEMIHLPIIRHIRRLLASSVIFGTAVLLMLWLPVRILRSVWPSFLPYTVALHTETQVHELSLELLLLQVILPALLEQSHTRQWLKSIIRTWCRAVAWALDLHSYLLGDETPTTTPPAPAPPPEHAAPAGGGLRAAHQALLQREGPTGFQPYTRPKFLALRLIILLGIVCISLVTSSLIALTLPVWLGRRAMELWLTGAPPPSPQPPTPGKVHELYTAACGTYLCWLGCRGLHIVASWLPQGRAAIVARIKQWFTIGARSFAACVLLLGIIPLLFGLFLELVVVIPLRVPLHQTPIHFIWQDWALGVLYTKIACACVMMGPDWRVRTAIERAYRDGLRGMDLMFITFELAAPVIICFGLVLAVPYVVAHSIVPIFVANPQLQNLIARRIYPFVLFVAVMYCIVVMQIKQFKKLYEHIKNDKYLVGQRLVNYDHRRNRTTNTSVSSTTSPPPPVIAH